MGSPYHILQEWLKQGLDDSFMADGACKGRPVEVQRMFFADNWRGDRGLIGVAHAKRICTLQCEVNVECLEYALAGDIKDGIWGGTLPAEREIIRRRRSTSTGDRPLSTPSAPVTPGRTVDIPTSGAPTLVG